MPRPRVKVAEVVQCLASAALAAIAIGTVVAIFRASNAPPFTRALAPLLAPAFWGFLIWKIWKNPRKWGLGVGVFLILLIPFHAWLFAQALANPNLNAHGEDWGSFFLYEAPNFIGGVACIALRFLYPDPSAAVSSKDSDASMSDTG